MIVMNDLKTVTLSVIKDVYFYLFAGNLLVISLGWVEDILTIVMLCFTITYAIVKTFAEYSILSLNKLKRRKYMEQDRYYGDKKKG